MKTTDWQTKALTLFIAAVALWFATACASEMEYEYPYKVITPSVPCGPDVPLTQSIELAQLKGTTPWERSRAMSVRKERLRPETERIKSIIDSLIDRFFMQDTIHSWGPNSVRTENGELTDKRVIEIWVTEYVDQNTYPPAVRIPECIDGIEVHFVLVPQGRLLTN